MPKHHFANQPTRQAEPRLPGKLSVTAHEESKMGVGNAALIAADHTPSNSTGQFWQQGLEKKRGLPIPGKSGMVFACHKVMG